jgi:rRNA maturation endonuclease Nob1
MFHVKQIRGWNKLKNINHVYRYKIYYQACGKTFKSAGTWKFCKYCNSTNILNSDTWRE